MSRKQISELLAELKAIESRIPDLQAAKLSQQHKYGICYQLTGKYNYLLLTFFQEWEHFTGCISYPVPAPNCTKAQNKAPNLVYDAAYNYYMRSQNKWVGEYGELRIELLRYCIQRLEGMLND